MPRKILAPHREQDGWVYWRLKATTGKNAANAPTINPLWLVKKDTLECVKASDIGLAVGYSDDSPGSRIISSRRVEEAVETADFLKLCAEEGLWYGRDYKCGWSVGKRGLSFDAIGGMPLLLNEDDAQLFGHGTTLREAYYRYKAEAELDAQQPGPFGDETKPVNNERFCFNCYYDDTPDKGQPCHDCINRYNSYDQYEDWSRPKWRAKND